MKRLDRTVEIELDEKEAKLLYDTEKLIENMKREVGEIQVRMYESDYQELCECLKAFYKITSRYNVHIICGEE